MGTIGLTRNQAEALRRVHLRGSNAWCEGHGRSGGAISRMFDRMKAIGLVTGPPYAVTELGLEVLEVYDNARGDPRTPAFGVGV